MKGHRLNGMIELRVNGWLKGNKGGQQRQSCFRPIESRHSVRVKYRTEQT